MVDLLEPWVVKASIAISLLATANLWLYSLSVKFDREYWAQVRPRRSSSGVHVVAHQAPFMSHETERSRVAA